jgi:hypothetical protein
MDPSARAALAVFILYIGRTTDQTARLVTCVGVGLPRRVLPTGGLRGGWAVCTKAGDEIAFPRE